MRVSSGSNKLRFSIMFQHLADIGMLATAGDADGMEKMIQLNLNTPMRLCHHLSKPMVEAKKGVIIDIASIAGVDAVSSQAAYSASKWGLHGWSESASGVSTLLHVNQLWPA